MYGVWHPLTVYNSTPLDHEDMFKYVSSVRTAMEWIRLLKCDKHEEEINT